MAGTSIERGTCRHPNAPCTTSMIAQGTAERHLWNRLAGHMALPVLRTSALTTPDIVWPMPVGPVKKAVYKEPGKTAYFPQPPSSSCCTLAYLAPTHLAPPRSYPTITEQQCSSAQCWCLLLWPLPMCPLAVGYGAPTPQEIDNSDLRRGVPTSDWRRGVPTSDWRRGVPTSDWRRGVPTSDWRRGVPTSDWRREPEAEAGL
ncbi:hypothetical protein BD413DRAFT_80898 [Trametes elegans]|nr:hypothetical protein BD413DRAFT_80898 [Trametes elegans]